MRTTHLRRCQWRLSAAVLLALMFSNGSPVSLILADDDPAASAAPRPTADETERRLERREGLLKEYDELDAFEKTAEAIDLLKKVRDIEILHFADEPLKGYETLNELQTLYLRDERFPAASEIAGAIAECVGETFGESSWRTISAKEDAKLISRLGDLNSASRGKLEFAGHLQREIAEAFYHRQMDEALRRANEQLDLRIEILGEDHLLCAASHNALGVIHLERNALKEARSHLDRAYEIREKTLGKEHPHVATVVENKVGVLVADGKYDKALALAQQAIATRNKVLDEKDGLARRLAERFELKYPRDEDKNAGELKGIELEELARLHPREEWHLSDEALSEFLAFARSLNNLAGIHQELGKFNEADRLFRQAVEMQEIADDSHAVPWRGSPDLVWMYQHVAEFRTVRTRLLRLEVREQRLLTEIARLGTQTHLIGMGVDDRRIRRAVVYNNATCVQASLGNFRDNATKFERVEEIVKKELGDEHPIYARVISNRAVFHCLQGDYDLAKTLLDQVQNLYSTKIGIDSPDYARLLTNLANVAVELDDLRSARELFKQAVKIRRETQGVDHPDYGKTLGDLAALHYLRNEFETGERLHRQALDLLLRSYGPTHPEYLRSLSNLSALYVSRGDPVKARDVARQVLETVAVSLGKYHPDYARSEQNMARFLYESGNLDAAEAMYRGASEQLHETLGKQHPDYAASLYDLALTYFADGRRNKAAGLCKTATQIVREHMLRNAVVQTEQQQLQSADRFRSYLSAYLASTARYEMAKSSHAARTLRVMAPFSDGAASRSDEVYDEVLAWKGMVTSRRWKDHREVTSDDLRESIPLGFALVDFVEYEQIVLPDSIEETISFEPFLAAFVVRRDSPVVRVELGALRRIAEITDDWHFRNIRDARGLNELGIGGHTNNPLDLRALLWQPLEAQLEGADTVLISPDGLLGRLPWAALPGKEEGTFLIEDVAIAIVPIPQSIPRLLVGPRGRPSDKPSLLLVGAVDYDAPSSEPIGPPSNHRAPKTDEEGHAITWPPLSGTRSEIVSIRDSYETRFPDSSPRTLRASQATEGAFATQAPGSRFLHVATHGFFAPRKAVASQVATAAADNRGGAEQAPAYVHPAIFSGLVLAGANLPHDDSRHDGVLTALEVQELNLGDVELATLSACETGIGKSAGIEGLIGLQRAFHVAGARSVVASLWKVDDKATQSLMIDFYENLWGKEMSKIEALRAAQLAMLREGGSRGVVIENDKKLEEGKRLAPYYWAAFVLSGDWR